MVADRGEMHSAAGGEARQYAVLSWAFNSLGWRCEEPATLGEGAPTQLIPTRNALTDLPRGVSLI